MRHYKIAKLSIQKHGNSLEENEDASQTFKTRGNSQKHICRASISDGASESIFAGEWAKLLVRGFCKKSFLNLENLQTQVSRFGKQWEKEVTSRGSLPWYVEEKARLGAFATFLGLELSFLAGNTESNGKWKACAIGDSCLFQVRQDELLFTGPVERSSQFGNSPLLISSIGQRNSSIWDKVQFLPERDCEVGDIFILATDALSYWFLKKQEEKERPWEELMPFLDRRNKGVFAKWVDQKRSQGMKNDDVTCIVIKID